MSFKEPIPKAHLLEIGKRYSIDSKKLNFVGGFENSVYSFPKNDQEYFVRIGNSKHMTFELVEAEIDWLLYLVGKKVPAVRPISSTSGQHVESVNMADVAYNVVAFEKAEREHVNHRDPMSWNSEIARDWGKVIGKMHSVTKKYTHKTSRRYEYNPGLDSFLYKKESKEIRDYIEDLFLSIQHLPKTDDSYGLVHSDIHTGNFFVKENKISAVLDFDRACYKWFVSELAIALYYPLYLTKLRMDTDEQRKFVSSFFPVFLEGYETENKLVSKWSDHLDLFIRARDVILLMYAPNEEMKKQLRPRILGKESYLDVLELIS